MNREPVVITDVAKAVVYIATGFGLYLGPPPVESAIILVIAFVFQVILTYMTRSKVSPVDENGRVIQ